MADPDDTSPHPGPYLNASSTPLTPTTSATPTSGAPISATPTFSILDLLQDIELQQSIVTCSQQLDDILGGGAPLAKITEICGEPGSGKTQLCYQLAVDVMIPECFGGVQGECLYVDCEQSFFLERFLEIARSTVEHLHDICDNSREQMEALKDFTEEQVLAKLKYIKCVDSLHLIALFSEGIRDILKSGRIKLIIIDSIAFHMRTEYGDYSLRTRVLSSLAQNLVEIAVRGKIAVVMTNHMTTKFQTDENTSNLVPSLGESWAYVSSTRLLLEQKTFGEIIKRRGTLLKSSTLFGYPETIARFQITDEGIRDEEEESLVAPTNCDVIENDVTDSEMMQLGSQDRHPQPSLLPIEQLTYNSNAHGTNNENNKQNYSPLSNDSNENVQKSDTGAKNTFPKNDRFRASGSGDRRMDFDDRPVLLTTSDDSGMETGSQKAPSSNCGSSSPPQKRRRMETT